jgi:2-keto-4-pentenoate hydratase
LDVGLKAGDIILSGTLGPVVPLKPGEVVAKVGGLGSASFNYQLRVQ